MSNTLPGQYTLFRPPTARDDMRAAIKNCLPESEHKDRWYKHYTDLAYKYATGYTAQGIRRFIMSDMDRNVVDALTDEELRRVEQAYRMIARYLYRGMDYEQIKAALTAKRKEELS